MSQKLVKNKIKTQWDLKSLFYSSVNDPQLEKDILQVKQSMNSFAQKYSQNKKYLSDEKALKKALDDYSELQKVVEAKPLFYLWYVLSLNSSDSKAEALSNKLSNEITQYENKILFFTLELGKVPKKIQKKFLTNPLLKQYHYFLSQLFDHARYQLSEPEEKVLNLKALPSHTLWVRGAEKLENKQMIQFKGKYIPLPEASGLLTNLPLKPRRDLGRKIAHRLEEISDFAENEINAIYTNKKIDDELRGIEKPYLSRFLGDEMEEKSVLALVKTVTENFAVSNRYHEVKRRLLKLSHLEYADRVATLGKIQKTFTFDETVKIIQESFSAVSPLYAQIFEKMIQNGQVDVYPQKGKRGGAFCSNGIGTPTVVLLNHTNTFYDVTVVAHEMGHAIHSELSKSQIPLYQHYSTAVAETASTLFERFVFDSVFKTLSPKEQIIALDAALMGTISTIFRQIAFFNFELDLHTQIREKGSVPKEEIATLMNTHVQKYLGKAFKLSPTDGYFFVKLSHMRNFFYVYTYAFGELVSHALYEKYIQDKRYIEKIGEFLRAGGSKSPRDIFKSIGIDITQANFFEIGIKSIEKDIAQLERMTKQY